MNLGQETQLTMVLAQATATTGTTYSAEVDMANWEGVIFFARIVTVNAGNFMKLQDAVVTATYAADIAGSKTTPAGSALMAKIDLYKPVMRFVRAALVIGSSSAVGDMYALQYRGRRIPITETATNTATLLVSPADGTA